MPQTIRDVNTLRVAVRKGRRPKFLFFWGHEPRRKGLIDQTCFSQWFAAGFTLDGVRYPTAEHYMMAEKARLFSDDATLAKILDAPHPGAAKQLGRDVRTFDEARWRRARYEIVVKGNAAKFSQNEPLKSFLLNTGHRVLVEASPVDRTWGIGLAADDPRALHPEQWRGLNLLGFALMDVRDALQTATAAA
jgi:ribA/ribD-fused uncharacterized protein